MRLLSHMCELYAWIFTLIQCTSVTFQEMTNVQTSAFLLNTDGTSIQLDITHRIGIFKSTIFVYLNNITQLNINGCRFIDADLFVDCIILVQNLQKLEMTCCVQFNEMHFLRMLPKLPKLSYVDLAKSSEISIDVAVCIMTDMNNLMFINFDPKKAKEHVGFWESLLRVLKHVHFGHNVRVCMPHYGNYWHMPQGSDDEDNDCI